MNALRHLLRTVVTGVVGLVATLGASLIALVLARIDPTSPRIDRLIRWWSRTWLRAAGCSLTVEGGENIDPRRSYVVVANHISNLDVMVCFVAVPLPIRFLAKKELFEIPLFASAMRAVGIVEVDRDSPRPVHAQINAHAEDLVTAGRSLIVYPEGTRSRAGSLAPFKKGAFTIAIATGLPVLPVTIHGTREAWPPGSPWVRGGSLRAVIDPPIETDGLTTHDAGAVRDEVHRTIERRLAEPAMTS